MCEDLIEQELGVLMVGGRLIRILKTPFSLVCFVLLFPLQQALEHTIFSAEKKLSKEM